MLKLCVMTGNLPGNYIVVAQTTRRIGPNATKITN
jgi:hypothetical protein